jgi:murein DD-endopeptidase MepM/ murein hydrolase activator NlpD
MYIAPTVGAMSLVHVGQKIGITQDLDSLHKGITPHIHFEVWVEGEHVNPVLWLRNYHEGLYDGKSTN